MKLLFNPYYDSKVFVKTDGCLINEKVVGPQGLLAELELRAGLTGQYLDDFQRAIFYSRAMKQALKKNRNLFFAKSFDKDKLGTSIILLRWRDALVKIGWNKNMTGSCRLNDLAEVETFFNEKGEADRWRQLLEYDKMSVLLKNTDKIEVVCKKENLELPFCQLFKGLEAKGYKVSYKSEPVNNELYKKAQVYSFKNDIEMAEWMAQQELGDKDVLVCSDTSILNLQLALEGKPQVSTENNAIGSIMQIFPLGLELFKKPININTLLPYLQLPATPLSSVCVKRQNSKGEVYYQSLSKALLKQLLEDNGIGEKWDELIEEAVYDYEGNDLTKSDKRRKALLFVNQWKEVSGQGDNCTVEKYKVVKYLEQMIKWAKTNLYDEEKAPQFNAIVNNCETMLLILEDEPDTVKTHDLMLWAAQISRPVELPTLKARKGSINVTDSVTNLHTAPDTLYWDCTMKEYKFQHELDFLNPGEADILKDNNIEVPDRETLLKAKREMMLSALSKVKERIVMLECDVIGGDVPVEDTVATELRLGGKLTIQQQSPRQHDMEEKPVEASSTKQYEYQINPIVFKRESESYSSLDELIQRPFDYVMDYILKLKEYGKAIMDSMDLLKGHVAHAYVEMLTEEGEHKVSSMRQIHNSRFDEKLDFLIETKGALLLLEENDLEFKRFKSMLKKSVDVLLDIIEQNQLTIVGAEQEYKANMPEIGNMIAKIDYLLTDKNGDYVILDLKWSESKTYIDKIEQNKALQLAVYRAVLEKYLKDTGDMHKVSFTGFYILPRHTLYTVDDTLNCRNGVEVVEPQDNSDLMKLATNSYKYRMKQLKDGVIEEGEGLELANMQYHKDAARCSLYPLETKYKVEDIKNTDHFDRNIVLKGGLE